MILRYSTYGLPTFIILLSWDLFLNTWLKILQQHHIPDFLIFKESFLLVTDCGDTLGENGKVLAIYLKFSFLLQPILKF